jgi:hypothetical protein
MGRLLGRLLGKAGVAFAQFVGAETEQGKRSGVGSIV